MFSAEGVPVFDADAAVHRLQGPDGRLVPIIERAFPGSTARGVVDRQSFGPMVLNDPAAMQRLEAIVHPAVVEERAAFLSTHADAPLVVLDIPLLFETAGERAVDAVVVVSAGMQTQRTRVLSRPGMTQAKLDAILARQTPDPEKRARADYVISTDIPFDETYEAVRSLIACLRQRASR
jgi:dephospho-CoA kinase